MNGFCQFLIQNCHVMWLTWSWTFLALATTVKASCGSGHVPYKSRPYSTIPCLDESAELSYSQDSGLSYSGAKIVTYGVPNYCQPPLPYTIQVPKTSVLAPSQSPGGKVYDYLVEAPRSSSINVGFELPVRVQAPVPINQPDFRDSLVGKSYGINVQGPVRSAPQPTRYKYDFAVQKAVPYQRQQKADIDYSINVQPGDTSASNIFLGPLPYALQVPTERQDASSSDVYLTGLKSKVDRILVPAYDINCPSCDDVEITNDVLRYAGDAPCL